MYMSNSLWRSFSRTRVWQPRCHLGNYYAEQIGHQLSTLLSTMRGIENARDLPTIIQVEASITWSNKEDQENQHLSVTVGTALETAVADVTTAFLNKYHRSSFDLPLFLHNEVDEYTISINVDLLLS